MRRVYKVGMKNPNWKAFGYDWCIEPYDNKEDAMKQKRHLQEHGWSRCIVKMVYIK